MRRGWRGKGNREGERGGGKTHWLNEIEGVNKKSWVNIAES